jgi:glycosyltransferase involved in cell wall biosynthesis
MLVSVIICTYRRAEALGRLLDCLARQTYPTFEVLIVDGSGSDPAVRIFAQEVIAHDPAKRFTLLAAQRGLTRQRNVGLRVARGDLICFFDDDITIEPDFLTRVVALFEQPAFAEIGGVTGYDRLHYPQPITLRWKLRRWLRSIPSLAPGAADHLGRNVPLSFALPNDGHHRVGWLPGFCMIFRRAAIANLSFDEQLPTYGGEDRDFSMDVGKRWQLLLCTELSLEHHSDPQFRQAGASLIYQVGFGNGRGFAKRRQRWLDNLVIWHYVVCEGLVDLLAFLQHPSGDTFRQILARPLGITAGFRSLKGAASAPHVPAWLAAAHKK